MVSNQWIAGRYEIMRMVLARKRETYYRNVGSILQRCEHTRVLFENKDFTKFLQCQQKLVLYVFFLSIKSLKYNLHHILKLK